MLASKFLGATIPLQTMASGWFDTKRYPKKPGAGVERSDLSHPIVSVRSGKQVISQKVTTTTLYQLVYDLPQPTKSYRSTNKSFQIYTWKKKASSKSGKIRWLNVEQQFHSLHFPHVSNHIQPPLVVSMAWHQALLISRGRMTMSWRQEIIRYSPRSAETDIVWMLWSSNFWTGPFWMLAFGWFGWFWKVLEVCKAMKRIVFSVDVIRGLWMLLLQGNKGNHQLRHIKIEVSQPRVRACQPPGSPSFFQRQLQIHTSLIH